MVRSEKYLGGLLNWIKGDLGSEMKTETHFEVGTKCHWLIRIVHEINVDVSFKKGQFEPFLSFFVVSMDLHVCTAVRYYISFVLISL